MKSKYLVAFSLVVLVLAMLACEVPAGFIRVAETSLPRLLPTFTPTSLASTCELPEFNVTLTDDPAGGVCTPSDCSLRQAVTLSNICSGTQTIRIPAGTYLLTNTGAGEEGNRSGDLDITDSLIMIGAEPHDSVGPPIVDGYRSDRVFDIKAGATVQMASLDIEHANAPGDGGGILNGGSLELTNVGLSNNEAISGGGIMNTGSLTINGFELFANQATTGGGIVNEGTIVLNDGSIEGSISSGHAGEGGGIWNRGHLEAHRVVLRHNTSGLNNQGDATFSQSAFIENTRGTSGLREGIRNTGTLTLENVTISANYRAVSNAGELLISFSTIANNIDGILSFDDGHRKISNSIVTGQTNDNCVGRFTSAGYNIESGNDCGFDQPSDLVNTNPLLNPLTMSGQTYIHAFDILAASPALDSADSAICPGTDQRGVTRPRGTGCDRGAFEADTLTSGTPGVVASATPTLVPEPVPLILILIQNANCRKGPGTGYNIVTSFEKGITIRALARNEQNTWSQVAIPSGGVCWLTNSTLEPPGAPDELPILTASPLPAAPATFSDKATCEIKLKKMSVKLSWSDISTESGYHIYRNGTLIATLNANVTVFTEDGLPMDHGITYEIEAFNAYGTSVRLAATVLACK